MDLILTSTDKSSKGKMSTTVVMTSCAPNLPPFGQSILSSHTLKFRPLSLGNTVFGCGESYIFCRKKEKHAGFIEFTSTPRNVYYYFLMLISLIFFTDMFYVLCHENVQCLYCWYVYASKVCFQMKMFGKASSHFCFKLFMLSLEL